MYQKVSLTVLYSFFDWLLNQKRTLDRRIMRRTKHKSSLGIYWKVYQLVYERATGQKINGPLNRGMHKACNTCVTSIFVLTVL
jgi:hypothetical protein